MGKAKTPSHIVTRRLYTSSDDEAFLDRKMHSLNRIYNVGVKHCQQLLKELHADERYKDNLQIFLTEKDDKKKTKAVSEIFKIAKEYGLTEYAIHEYLGVCKVRSYPHMNIDIVQKCGTNLYSGVKKVIMDPDKTLSFRKQGQTDSFEAKKNSTGIIYNGNTVTVMGRKINIKPIRKTDDHMMWSLRGRVKYCRIVRKADRKHGFKYYVQIVVEGPAEKKLKSGSSTIGIDNGTSTVASYDGSETDFQEIAPDVKKYNRKIKKASEKYERRCRMANKDCYNSDGTPIKGKKHKVRTKGMKKALQELKYAYRRKSDYIKQWHNHYANQIIRKGNIIIREPMNWKALARRAKATSRKDIEEYIKKKNGEQVKVRKYKRKKRYGSSISNRSPGYGCEILKKKAEQYGGCVIEVNATAYKASQYDHSTGEYNKPLLKERTKIIDGKRVSRDLYSAFLLYHMSDTSTINAQECIDDFKNFLICQENTIMKVRLTGDNTKTFGLRDF